MLRDKLMVDFVDGSVPAGRLPPGDVTVTQNATVALEVCGKAGKISEVDESSLRIPRIHQVGAVPTKHTTGGISDHGERE